MALAISFSPAPPSPVAFPSSLSQTEWHANDRASSVAPLLSPPDDGYLWFAISVLLPLPMATARWQFFQKNDDDDTDDTDLFLSSFSEKSIHYNIYIIMLLQITLTAKK